MFLRCSRARTRRGGALSIVFPIMGAIKICFCLFSEILQNVVEPFSTGPASRLLSQLTGQINGVVVIMSNSCRTIGPQVLDYVMSRLHCQAITSCRFGRAGGWYCLCLCNRIWHFGKYVNLAGVRLIGSNEDGAKGFLRRERFCEGSVFWGSCEKSIFVLEMIAYKQVAHQRFSRPGEFV